MLCTKPVLVPTCLSKCEHLPAATMILGHEEKVGFGFFPLYIMTSECTPTASAGVHLKK